MRSELLEPGKLRLPSRGATTIAVVNFKGGVAKTLTVANLGPALAALGLRVLLVDFDPQADLSASWGIEEDHTGVRVEEALADPDVDPSSAWVELPVSNGATGRLGLLPAGRALRGQTALLLEGSALTGVLDPFRDVVDVILVDTPAGEASSPLRRWSPPMRCSFRCCPAITRFARCSACSTRSTAKPSWRARRRVAWRVVR